MEITSVEKNRKNKGRYSVYIDSSYSFSISEEDYLSLGLYEKKEITEEEINYINDTVNFRAAKSDAIKYLTTKLRTEKEVKLKLLQLGYDKATVEKAVAEIKALGYINNKIYVQKYVFDRSKLKPISKKLLRTELLAKGIDSEDIDEVLNNWDMDESVVAENLVKKKFGKYDMNEEKIIQKMYNFLRHRGFSSELVEEVLARVSSSK